MRTVLRLLAVVAFLAGVVGFLAQRGSGGPVVAEDCPTEDDGCAARDSAADPGVVELPPVDSLQAELVCPGAGYLCPGLEDRGTWRVIRWDEATPMIRIRVPLPPVEDRGVARALQAAAARGIQTWHGHPFPLRVDLSERPGRHDFTVRWSLSPTGRELGHASTRWRRSGDEATLRVEDFSLTILNPLDIREVLSPHQVELTAAHEMGHALGLPHSDRETDVMYPANTATRLTSRDFRTMEALYQLGNGAEIVHP